MKKALVITVAVIMCVCFATLMVACGEKDDWEYIQSKGTLVVGVTDYPPMDYQDADGTWTGFDAEVAKLVGEALGLKVEFVLIDWDAKVTELKSKKIDVIWNGMTVTEELGASMDFSYSYAENYQVAVVKSANVAKYATIAAMKSENAKVVAEGGSAGYRVAESEFDSVTDVLGQTAALLDVAMGTSDVAFVDYTIASANCGKGGYADLIIVPGISYENEEFAIGIRKGSALTAKINEQLVKLYKDGTMETLKNQFGAESIALKDLSNK